jgi:hypothetical protein
MDPVLSIELVVGVFLGGLVLVAITGLAGRCLRRGLGRKTKK